MIEKLTDIHPMKQVAWASVIQVGVFGFMMLSFWIIDSFLQEYIMAKQWNTTTVINHTEKGTSIGARPKSMATMNKHKKRSFKKYRGQGK